MRCPKCGNQVLDTDNFCNNCNMNLSFTTKPKDSYNKIGDSLENIDQKVNNLKGKIILISAVAVIILMALITFLDFFLLLKFLVFIKTYSKVFISIGVALLLVWMILFFNKKRGLLLKTVFSLSLILIIAPVTLSSMINIEGDFSFVLTDYSKKEYIEIGSEQIPTIYSVVGYREVEFNVAEKDYYDEGIKAKMDFVSIVYKNLSYDDRELYKSKIMQLGYNFDYIVDEDGEIHNFYIKNKNDNTFYMISVIDNEITYSKGNGSFEDLKKE